jgi:hypothetical protein
MVTTVEYSAHYARARNGLELEDLDSLRSVTDQSEHHGTELSSCTYLTIEAVTSRSPPR